ncbi:MAG: hypothetical protein QOG10_3118 [Kribbellaceae bacterium]|nr:hypothetical protein [Kribbellaceae bacterium]
MRSDMPMSAHQPRASAWIRSMTNWVALQDAYGSARDVPNLLAAAEAGTGDDRGVWDELWGRLCHQGTV